MDLWHLSGFRFTCRRLLPRGLAWSATFTGHLEGAEAIYNGARGNLVGIRTRLGNTPQHGVLFGMTGAGKSVIVADLLAQIGHRFGFRLIVEEGLSHAVLTQTQGCEPVIINPNGLFWITKSLKGLNPRVPGKPCQRRPVPASSICLNNCVLFLNWD